MAPTERDIRIKGSVTPRATSIALIQILSQQPHEADSLPTGSRMRFSSNTFSGTELPTYPSMYTESPFTTTLYVLSGRISISVTNLLVFWNLARASGGIFCMSSGDTLI